MSELRAALILPAVFRPKTDGSLRLLLEAAEVTAFAMDGSLESSTQHSYLQGGKQH